ncbi:putative ATP-binding cassette transporter/putative ATP-binding cassette transporter [Roseiarcus fermentans]|uniref:Putative ATP-binding cassette transporter/putative ATP-binding cassette transporter n=1 Tax=Roseiarcus fermentans TaxID=1473586 RepID=A0A366F075_9HYPH|nr:ATP-binding cassette domain-containing protein [Roseiarcus fermentans]RBP07105.1 putative ATP-binding cassette transporter/putative ATP-binding cassette transporter [Roseiarcus fermentans]
MNILRMVFAIRPRFWTTLAVVMALAVLIEATTLTVLARTSAGAGFDSDSVRFVVGVSLAVLMIVALRSAAMLWLQSWFLAAVSRLRLRIAARLSQLAPETVERLGPERLRLALLVEGARVRDSVEVVTDTVFFVAVHLVMIAGVIALAPMLGAAIFVTYAFAFSLFVLANLSRGDLGEDLSAQEQQWSGDVEGLRQGVAVLKLFPHAARLYLTEACQAGMARIGAMRTAQSRASAPLVAAANMMFLALSAAIVCAMPLVAADERRVALGAIATVLAFPPLSLVRFFPVLVLADQAAGELLRLARELDAAPREPRPRRAGGEPFAALSVVDVVYDYATEGDAARFRVGPAVFEVEAGEIIFLVGHNGSGKSTILSLLAGRRDPLRGTIAIDGVAAHAADLRMLSSTILSDHHLGRVVCGMTASQRAAFPAALDRLGVADSVSPSGEMRLEGLSRADRRRIALADFLVRPRPLLILDEWAADQSPDWRLWFYTELLPELRRDGVTVIAATHDDRFLAVADQVVTMRAGRVVSIERNRSPAFMGRARPTSAQSPEASSAPRP